MSDVMSPSEMKYFLISFIGLLLITSMLTSVGMAEGHYDPPEPQVNDELEDESTYQDTDSSIWSDTPLGFLDTAINTIANTMSIMVALFNAWGIVLSNAGWASAFIIAPMTIMSLIVANGVLKILSVIAQAVPM